MIFVRDPIIDNIVHRQYIAYVCPMHSHRFCLMMMMLAGSYNAFPQAGTKQVKEQFQVWVSMNTVLKIKGHWGAIGDLHLRRNHGLQDPGFYFLRLGTRYWIRDNMHVSAGVAHLWSAPSNSGIDLWGQENRIYQEFQYAGKSGRTGITQRVRNEQRWQKIPVNDLLPAHFRFTNRVRYLVAFNIPLCKNPRLPMLSVSDELMVQFGKDVVNNNFDQNRFFIGIRQPINTAFSFDFGYMNVYQQRASGFQYNMNHTLRLFFYYTGHLARERD